MTTEDVMLVATARRWVAEKSGKQRRERHHLTAQEIATALGVTVSAVLSWEKGRSQPRGPVASRWVQLIRSLDAQADADVTAKVA